jgi:RNA polymerase sigma factor (TIGR02999 family)
VVCLPGVCGKFDGSNLDARDSKEMENPSTKDVTELLRAWSGGDREALDKLAPVIHAELHRLAHAYMGRERPGHILQTSALVNEAYLRLIDWENAAWQNRAHFFGVAAQMMRRILVDHARAHEAEKRGGEFQKLSLDENLDAAGGERDVNLVALDDALNRLAEMDPQKSKIVELRFFGGLSVEETAEVLGVSAPTVKRQWRMAKAWLYGQVKPS